MFEMPMLNKKGGETKIFALLAILLATTFIMNELAFAEPIQFPANGHYYKAISVSKDITWNEANDLATQAGGYLATITSEEEDIFVFNLINNPVYWHLAGQFKIISLNIHFKIINMVNFKQSSSK